MKLRFEERVGIELTCCGKVMELCGNLSLREAGASCTQLGYQCGKCFRRVMVTDAWAPSTPAIDAAHDAEP